MVEADSKKGEGNMNEGGGRGRGESYCNLEKNNHQGGGYEQPPNGIM